MPQLRQSALEFCEGSGGVQSMPLRLSLHVMGLSRTVPQLWGPRKKPHAHRVNALCGVCILGILHVHPTVVEKGKRTPAQMLSIAGLLGVNWPSPEGMGATG